MEEIIIGKKCSLKCEKVQNKKILFHNSQGEILIYENFNGIVIPRVLFTRGSKIENLISDEIGISINENSLQELIRFVSYQESVRCINGKLEKIGIQRIREYYSYYIDFNSDIISSIIENTSEEELKPYLISISDFLHSIDTSHPSHCRHKLAVEELDKRLRYIKY